MRRNQAATIAQKTVGGEPTMRTVAHAMSGPDIKAVTGVDSLVEGTGEGD